MSNKTGPHARDKHARPESGETGGADALLAQVRNGRLIFAVRVTPRAGRDTLTVENGQVRARLRAAPVEGAANAALVALFADVLRIPKKDVEIVRGHTAREKQVAISGLSPEEFRQRLNLS